jgi:hypothetical protein
VTLVDADDVGDDASFVTARIYEDLRRARAGEEAPRARAGVLAATVVHVAGTLVHDVGAARAGGAAEPSGPAGRLGQRGDLVLPDREDVRDVARRVFR